MILKVLRGAQIAIAGLRSTTKPTMRGKKQGVNHDRDGAQPADNDDDGTDVHGKLSRVVYALVSLIGGVSDHSLLIVLVR